jgi:hypothetical protein
MLLAVAFGARSKDQRGDCPRRSDRFELALINALGDLDRLEGVEPPQGGRRGRILGELKVRALPPVPAIG